MVEIFFYTKNISEYAVEAGHLSLAEHGALTLLTDRYLARQVPIPEKIVHAICRARTKAEQAAVDSVLLQFFQLEEGAWRNRKLDAEIEKIQTRSEISRQNGQKGGRKKAQEEKEEKPQQNQEEDKPGGLPVGNQEEGGGEAIQQPQAITYNSKNTNNHHSGGVFFNLLPGDLPELAKSLLSDLPTQTQANIVDELLGRIRAGKAETPESLLRFYRRLALEAKSMSLDFARAERKRRAAILDLGTPEERAQKAKATLHAQISPETITPGLNILEKFGASSLAERARKNMH